MIEYPSLALDFGAMMAGGGGGKFLVKEFFFVRVLAMALACGRAVWPFSSSGAAISRSSRGIGYGLVGE